MASTYADCIILSIPLGPRVLLTRSPTAMAPTKAVRRAFSPFSSVVPSSKIWVGLKEDCVFEMPVSQSKFQGSSRERSTAELAYHLELLATEAAC
jgi:hypothetical protein